MKETKRKLNSWQEAQQQIGAILESLNANHSLMLAAASNPLLALQELGYEIAEDVHQEFEDRIRLGASGAKRLQSLREEIFKIAGKPFNLNSAEELSSTLSVLLKQKGARALSLADARPLLSVVSAPTAPDPLEQMRDLHPIMGPLLEYRRLDASTPRFATRELYDEIRQGKHSLPITKITAHLKSPS